MKITFLIILLAITADLNAQSPMKKTLAFSRETIAGIPNIDSTSGASPKNISTSYFIYIIVEKGSHINAAHVWLKGKYYTANLQKTNSPVLAEHDAAVPTGQLDTLVSKTSSDVYQVTPDEESKWNSKNTIEQKLTRTNEVVVFLRINHRMCYGSVKKIRALTPLVGM